MNLLGQVKLMVASHSTLVSKYFGEIAVIFTTVMTLISYALGGWDTALKALLTLVAIDIITGVFVAFYVKREFASKRLREGFGTKVMYLIVIAIGNVLDGVLFADAPVLRTMACYFYIYVESMSTLENLGNMGVPLPQKFIDKMAQINTSFGGTAKMKDGKFVASDSNDDDEIAG